MRATAGTVTALAVALVLLTGCAATSTEASVAPATTAAPSVAPAPPPTAAVDVPRVSSALSAAPDLESLSPQRIRVDSLGIDMAIEPVGLAAAGDMALPKNPDVAAWYRFGPVPSSATGATVIAAHVDALVYGLGPFAKLAEAPAGTEIVVTTTDGTEHRYAIDATETMPKGDVPWGTVFDRDGPSRLTLVTCGGEFDYENLRYSSNVIVSAQSIP
ncbi:class F sortase [Cryobacterium sp. CG_9.6]|uniref:class F sortase n=1 Tax=Cryobacterium sp. CG_9.6 TaxID=2760710 RepID=UPI0024736115|nr:class F sortase [Cryobacterium sp. CG_9.6]MDH6235861.1 hypothetical protein [Cryobacterium sp. CG_9.6]